MSSDTNFSSKIEPDVKDRLLKLIDESTLTSKDFMTRLVQSFEASQARESLGQVKELEQLQHHLARIQEIYVSNIKAARDRQEADAVRINNAEAQAQEARAEAHARERQASDAIDSANERVQQAEAQAALVREQADNEIKEIRETLDREKEAREQSARLASLAEQAASSAHAKAVELEELAKEAVKYREECNDLRATNKSLKGKVIQLEGLLDKTSTEAKSEIEMQAEKFRETVERLKEQHNNSLARVTEIAELEKEKAILTTQKEFIQEISQLRELLSKCREEKAQLEAQLTIIKSQKGGV